MNTDELRLKSLIKVKLNDEYGQIIQKHTDTDFNSTIPDDQREYKVRLRKSLRAFWFKGWELERIERFPG